MKKQTELERTYMQTTHILRNDQLPEITSRTFQIQW